MAIIEPIKVTGLAQFSRDLKKIDSDLPKALRIALNQSSLIVVDWAQGKVPSRSGAARRSIKAKSTRTEGRVTGGGPKVPYYPWLDFGGRVGKKRSVKRPFIKSGRYIYPGYTTNMIKVNDVLTAALLGVVRDAGVEVTE